MSIGHSQGGGAVWKLAEHPLVQSHDSGYLGTVSIAPAANALDLAITTYEKILPLEDFHNYVIAAEMLFLVQGIKAAYPDYHMPWAAEALRKRLQYAEAAQSCAVATLGLTLDLPRDELVAVSANLTEDETLIAWSRINAAAQGVPASMPMLLIQGLNDTSILPECTVRAFENATANGNKVHLLEYPGLDHSATVGASSPAWLKFIRERFTNCSAAFKTTRTTVDPFNITVAKTPLDFENPFAEVADEAVLGGRSGTMQIVI